MRNVTRNYLALAAALLVSPVAAQAQVDIRNLGRDVLLSATCNVGSFGSNCSQATFTLTLDGLEATDNNGAAVPGAITAYDAANRGLRSATFGLQGGTFTALTSTPAGLIFSIDGGGNLALAFDQTTPLQFTTITFGASLAGTVTGLSASGQTYIDRNTNFVNTAGVAVGTGSPTAPGVYYRTADFNTAVALNVVPEPSTYLLMATGLGALGFVARRRRA
jgi:hypothetical protein